MRVAYVCTDPGIPVFGTKGASVHVQAVLRVLVRAGADVELVCARTGGDPPPDLAHVPVHRLPAVRGDAPSERERSAQGSDAAVAGVLATLDRHRPLDLVYERYSLWGRSATTWAGAAGRRSLLEVNAPLVEEQARHRALTDRAGAEQVAVSALSAADASLCVTETVAAWARRRAAHPARVHIVPNGVDTAAVRPAGRDVTTATDAPFTIGFVGTLKAWHGVDVLVHALADLARRDPAYRLLVVGDGPEAGRLDTLAASLGVTDLIERTGAVRAAEVPVLLHRMDVAAAPYPPLEDFYFSPLKVYEYLAAGLPVVASRIGVLPDLLRHGELGTLVEPNRPDLVADAVEALRADVTRRAWIRSAAVAEAAGHDWSQVVARGLGLVGLSLPEAHHAA